MRIVLKVNIALFAADSSVTKKYAAHVVKAGAVMIDNSSAFRMDANAPLVIPEVNPEALSHHKGSIANPNGST